MRLCLFAAVVLFSATPACNCNSTVANGPDSDLPADLCDPACPDEQVCRYATCIAPPKACNGNLDCLGDTYCDTSRGECLPWGLGPGGTNDPTCKRDPVPGVFFPGAQCEWLAPPAGDPYPNHTNVLATPMVASFYRQGEFAVPSIVFTSYNNEDGGHESCVGDVPEFFGVIRVIDGRSCEQQATLLPTQGVIASASVAIADVGGLDGTPEIIAVRQQGGLVAFTLGVAGWEILWETTSQFGDASCNWSGPSIHDLDDDGVPEVLLYGAVYNATTGATIDESLGELGAPDGISTGYIPIVADLDGNGAAELVTGKTIYTWNVTTKIWEVQGALSPTSNGHVAIADFGTYPQAGADDRATLDGVPEVAIIHSGESQVFNVFGRRIFNAPLIFLLDPLMRIGKGGPPTIADFDGDGRVEFASAGASAYVVFDPDCTGTPDAATCSTLRADGILWAQPSQDFSSNTTGSSVFDFDGDDRAEVVYGDECFTRVYDGTDGKVVYSRYRTSCTWYENPVIADTDADFNAEIVSTSNTNCNVICPLVDPIFDGVQCLDDSDCPATAPCRREAMSDALGRCRCELDADCGGDGFVCLDPAAGASAAGKVCRASHPADVEASGVRVLADGIDRWINTRSVWNQHAYAVTNIGEDGKVPRTSAWVRNWQQPGLNNFRQNTPGDGQTAGAIPDLTIKTATVACETGGPVVTATVCNRGTEPVAQGLPISIYAKGPPEELRCATTVPERIYPTACTQVTCAWTGAPGPGVVVVDDRGPGVTGTTTECREDNNAFDLDVSCP